MQKNKCIIPSILSMSRKSDADCKRSQALSAYIIQKIKQSAYKIPFAEFMQHALYHPNLGYYQAKSMCIGKKGDFVTAPEISPLFAYCFATHIAKFFKQMPKMHHHILELGAGSGRFACDVLDALSRSGHAPYTYAIFEKSTVLRQQQQALLRSTLSSTSYARCVWLDALPRCFSGIVLANELLDALPVHRFRVKDHVVQEVYVAWDDAKGFVPYFDSPNSDQLSEIVHRLLNTYHLNTHAPYESEVHLSLVAMVEQCAKMLDQGVILFSDYGYREQEYYHPLRTHGSLSCFFQHHAHDNPYILVGLQDMTAHVNFSRVLETAERHGCTLLEFTTQADFLLANNLIEHAACAELGLNERDAFALHQAIKVLTFPMEMGERVKMMALAKGQILTAKKE